MRSLFTICFILFCLNISLIYSQDKTFHLNFEQKVSKSIYSEIDELSKKLLYHPEDIVTQIQLGKCYLKLKQYDNALFNLYKGKELMKNSVEYQLMIYQLGLLNKNSNLAQEAFEKYLELSNSESKSGLMAVINKGMIEQTYLPYFLNNDAEKTTYFPYLINSNQIQLLNRKVNKTITSAIDFEKYLTDVYTNKDTQFSKSNTFFQPDKPNGYKYGPYTLNRLQTSIYITRWDEIKGRLYIYHSQRKSSSGSWGKFKKLKIESDDLKSNFLHPMYSYDENKLIFCSNKEGGQGGYDLWVGEIKNDTLLVKVKNLGTNINTPGDECFPTVSENMLFFSSNGHYGLGNLDLYICKYRQGEYAQVQNMGRGINSNGDDYALFYNKQNANIYFTSNRNSGEVMTDQIFTTNIDLNDYKSEVLNAQMR